MGRWKLSVNDTKERRMLKLMTVNRKKVSAYIVCIMLVVGNFLPFGTVKGETVLISGQCGADAYYELGADNILRISGTGELDIEQFSELTSEGIEDKVKGIVFDNTITKIPENTFKNYSAVETVEFPRCLDIIEANAFANCNSLKTVILPRTVSLIANYAFFQCQGLENVYILMSGGVIEPYAFVKCDNIRAVLTTYGQPASQPDSWPDTVEKIYCNIHFSKDMLHEYATNHDIPVVALRGGTTPSDGTGCLVYEDGLAFVYGDGSISAGKIDYYITGKMKNLMIVNGITKIEESAFSGEKLETVILPESITTIEASAFYNNSLKEITIPSKVSEITTRAFQKCPSLTTMTIKNPNIVINESGMPENLQTIYGYKGSTAETYAMEHQINFINIDVAEPEPTMPETTTQDTITEETTEEESTTEETTTEETTVVETSTEEATTEETTTKNMIVEETTTEETATKDTTAEETTIDKITKEETTQKTLLKGKNDNTLASVVIKSVKEKNYHTVKLTWKKVEKASYFKVYRATKKNGKYKCIASTKKIRYIDKSVKGGKKYFYKIQAVGEEGGTSVSAVRYIGVKGKPSRPKITMKQTKKTWGIYWGIIEDNSKGIQVYMKNGQGKYKKFTKINETKKLKKRKNKKGITGILSSIDSLQPGKTYYFRARTYAVIKGKKVYSKWSKVKKLRR